MTKAKVKKSTHDTLTILVIAGAFISLCALIVWDKFTITVTFNEYLLASAVAFMGTWVVGVVYKLIKGSK